VTTPGIPTLAEALAGKAVPSANPKAIDKPRGRVHLIGDQVPEPVRRPFITPPAATPPKEDPPMPRKPRDISEPPHQKPGTKPGAKRKRASGANDAAGFAVDDRAGVTIFLEGGASLRVSSEQFERIERCRAAIKAAA
jgi:hypothetical protein